MIGLGLVVVGAVLVPVAWYLQARAGERTLLLWWQAAGLTVTAAGLILSHDGWPRLRAVAFPLLFPVFALPVPDALLSRLQPLLQNLTTTLAETALPLLGVAVERSGFVLRLPGGDLGVAEACSGVRSLTALTATAGFVAYLRGFGPVRGVALVVLAVPLVGGVNAFRVVLTGLIQEAAGQEYIQGWWHEALGFGTLFVGLAGILGAARVLGPPAPPADPLPPPPVVRPGAAWVGAAAAAVVAAAVGVSGWVTVAGRAAAEQAATAAPLDEIPLVLGLWRGEDRPVAPYVAEMLSFDRAVYRVYENNLGRQAHAWVLFWRSAVGIKGYHHPDVCWPSRGYVPTGGRREPVPVPGCGTVAADARDFANGPDRTVVVSWTQEGRHVWTDADEDRAAGRGVLDGENFSVASLLLPTEAGHPSRLTVMVAVPAGGSGAHADAVDLAGRLAAEVYRLCPWAAPAPNTAPEGDDR